MIFKRHKTFNHDIQNIGDTTMTIEMKEKQFDATQGLSTKDVYFRLCTCLDREIELVWKRAVFLTAFLIAAFAGYGGLIATYLGAEKHHAGDFAVVSIAAIGIAFVGMALSIIWIMMAKGSKAWQEHYEKVIECFVANHKSGEVDLFAQGDYRKLIKEGRLEGSSDKQLGLQKIGSFFISTTGGRFSVSKIVIVLGQLFFLTWTAIATLHCWYLSGHAKLSEPLFTRFAGTFHPQLLTRFDCIIRALFWILVVVLAISFITCVLNCRAMSDYLSDLESYRKRRIVRQTLGSRVLVWWTKHCPLRRRCQSTWYHSLPEGEKK